MKDTTKERILKHFKNYPKLEIRDLFKYIFQSAFGCEHLVSDESTALAYVLSEAESITAKNEWRVDPLDGNYSRVHICCLGDRITPEVLTHYFCLSARTEEDGLTSLLEKIESARELIKEGVLPFSLIDFDKELALWREAGYPAIHHSAAFREEYRPAYRVISNEYLGILKGYLKDSSDGH